MNGFQPATERILHQLTVSIAVGGLALLLGSSAIAQVEAIDADAAEAMRKQGVSLVYSSNIPTDETREGLRLLEAAVEAGNVDAMVSLGAVYLYGAAVPQDWPKALGYFEAASAAGNWSGLYQYGMMLMWSQRDATTAEAILVKTGEMGIGKAWTTLASGAMWGYLGGGSVSRAKFDGYAEKARAAGEQKVDVLEATRHMWGISVTASGPETIAILERAADAGNAEAAAHLVRLTRSGNRMNIRRNTAKARAYLETYRPLFSDVIAWQLDVSITAAEARSNKARAAVADLVFSHPQFVTKDFGADLYKANQNTAIYLLQIRLAQRGYDVGPADGFAGRRTLQAMNQACRKIAPIASCDDSVMRPDVISALIEKL